MKLLNSKISLLIASIMAAMLPARAECSDIAALLNEASRERAYRQADNTELRRAEELFAATLKGESPATLKEKWRALNFELEEIAAEKEKLILLKEREGHRTGRGFYLVRQGGIPLMLQMPHSFKDGHTRRIGLDMALTGRCRVAAWNTTPRWYDENGVRIDADLAHHPRSYFTALTRAFAQAVPGGTVAQLHGFEARKRKSASGATADVIVSSGRRTVTSRVRRAAECLAVNTGARILIYPSDVRELGGTSNSIGMLLGNLGNSGFIHLELGASFRDELKESRALRATMNRCLEEAAR